MYAFKLEDHSHVSAQRERFRHVIVKNPRPPNRKPLSYGSSGAKKGFMKVCTLRDGSSCMGCQKQQW